MNLRFLLATTVIAMVPAASAFAQTIATNPSYAATTNQGAPLAVAGLAAALFAAVVGGVVYVAGKVITPGGGAPAPQPAVTAPPAPPAPSAYTPSGPSVSGSGAQPNATIQVFDGSTSLGSTTASSAGVWSLLLASPLQIGSHSLTATQTVSGATSTASSALVVSVTTLAPSGLKTDVALSSPLANISPPAFVGTTGQTGAKEILIDQTTAYQSILGVGAALTDSACYELMSVMTAAQRSAYLQECFGTNGFQTVRICMGDSDYCTRVTPNSTSPYAYQTYDDTDQTGSFPNFSMAIDDVNVFPILKQALTINPNIVIIGSPWSPPSYFCGGAALAATGNNKYYSQTSAHNSSYAQYFVLWAQGVYSRIGRYPDFVTLQNEPNFNPGNYPGCRYNGADLAALGAAVRSAFDAANVTTQILAGDASWGDTQISAGNSLVQQPLIASPAAFAGAAYHAYDGGSTQATTDLAAVTAAGGTKAFSVHMTEMSMTASDSAASKMSRMGGDLGVGAFRNLTSSITLWNIALAPDGTPGIRTGLEPLANVSSSGALTRSVQFYFLAHIARYVKRGAVRIACNTFAVGMTGTDVQAVAFLNPDGTVVTFLYNSNSATQTVTLKDQSAGGSYTSLTMNTGDIATVTWKQPAAVVAPDLPVIVATPGAGSVTYAWGPNGPPSNNGAPATYALYAATASGAEVLVANNVTLPYTLSGLTAGTAEYAYLRATNSAGSTNGAEVSATPTATVQHALKLTGTQNAGAFASPTAATSSNSNVRVARFYGAYNAYAGGGSSGAMNLLTNANSSATNGEWFLGCNFQGAPLAYGYDTGGNFRSATGSAAWTSASYKLMCINGSTSAFTLNMPKGAAMTGGTIGGSSTFSVPAGGTAFFESTDGQTWTQVGSTITTWTTGGIKNNGAGNTAIRVGSIDSTTTNIPPTGNLYRATATDGTTTLFDIDFTAQTTGATTLTAATGPNWTIYGSGVSET